jgi:CubicO group peptidase (beta-lactamase class C family)
VRRRIFAPLGMTSTTFDAGAVPTDRLAAGYLRLERAGSGWSGYAAGERQPFPMSGALLSTANDIGRFVRLQFRRPSPGEARVLSPGSIREMWRPVAATGPFGGMAAGIGWFVAPYGPYTLVRKDGGQPGFTAHVALVPEVRLGAVVLVNESPERVRASGTSVAKVEQLVLARLLAPVVAAARAPADQATGTVAPMDARFANASYQRASAGREPRQSSLP